MKQDYAIASGMPAAVDAERSILASIMLDEHHLAEAVEVLDPDDFSLSSHRMIYLRMIAVSRKGFCVDIITMSEELSKAHEVEAVGGLAYVASLQDGMPRRPNITQWIKIVKEKSDLRRIIHTCNSAIEQAQDGTDPLDLSRAIENSLLQLEANKSKTESQSITEVIPEVVKELEFIRSRGDGLVGMTTGIADLDCSTTGIRPGEYWVAGAAPSRGKTVLGTQIAMANAEAEIPTLVFSYEMTCRALVKRIMVQNGVCDAKQIRDPRFLKTEQWHSLLTNAGMLARRKLPLYIEDLADTDISALVSKAKLHIRKHGVKLIVVDFLQKVNADGRERRDKVSSASNQLRVLAKREQVGILALSQLRRPQAENDIPSLHDLKESGDIEGDAHVVLLIHRPKKDDHSWTFEDTIFIAKQREGITGPVPVCLMERRLKFEQRDSYEKNY